MTIAHEFESRPALRVVHRFRNAGMDCGPGEEVAAAYLLMRGKECLLPLSLTLLLIVDYLARHRLPLTATQIAAGLRVSAFHKRHGMNSGIVSRRKISRSAVKEYVKRIRTAIGIALQEEKLTLDPRQILASVPTVSNEVRYRLNARIEWQHTDDLPYEP